MPSTYNGVGTHYYGKANCEGREAECRFCRRTVNLKSYDTRLWFVVFFIPVIPLGRKRIVDFCPACTRHYAVDADKWETAKQLNISGALENFRANPTAEAAIEAHQQLTNYHQTSQAAEFRGVMAEKFGDNAKVQTYLGFVLADLGKQDEAIRFFQRALELRPDLPDARVGLAGAYIRAWRLDDARHLLDFLEKPGAVQLYSLEPLEDLANAYQKNQRHGEALELYAKLLEAIPTAAQHKGFRARVQTSEKALGRKRNESMLPAGKFNWREFFSGTSARVPSTQFHFTGRGLILVGAALAVLAAVLAFANDNIRRHRKLYVVNGFNEPVLVKVTGFAPLKPGFGVSELALPEGRHHASISGAVNQEIDFDIHAGYFDRFFDHPAWVLNPGSSALLLVRTAVYSSKNPQPAATSFQFGQTFYALPGITHPFQELPESVYMKRSEERTYTQVELFRDEPANVFFYLQGKNRAEEAVRLAEWRLRGHPDDEAMMDGYCRQLTKNKQLARAQNFFKAGLTNRPVRVEWHRAYQHLCRNLDPAQLASEYESLLAAEPTNSALLYLRGRTCTNDVERLVWFERAQAADSSNPYPAYALGYNRAAQGDWAGARPLLAQACLLRPKDETFRYWFSLTRLALGEFSSLDEELRARLKRNPLDLYSAIQLVETLAAAGKKPETEKVAADFDRAIIARPGQNAQEQGKALHRTVFYASGDFAALERYVRVDKSPGARESLFQALVEQGRLAEAEKLRPDGEYNLESSYQLLAMSLAWRRSGDTTRANAFLQRALKEFEAGDREMLRAAALLRSQAAPSPEALEALIATPKSKAILAAALALQYPAQGTAFAATARKLNVDRTYPYHLVQRVTAPVP